MKVKTEKDIPSNWERKQFKKKTTVQMRPCNGVETFKVSWQDSELVSDPELDVIVIQNDGKEYPCKKDIFFKTYEWTDNNTMMVPSARRYRKVATSTLVAIPEGVDVEIETLEGTLPKVSFPDYIVIGVEGELYANTKDFVEANLVEV